ncbi:MAG: OsmC family protein [Gemmatimonadota bacterium]
MPKRKAKAVWTGSLAGGSGKFESETGAIGGAYTFASRFEEGDGTNPEELIAAAHSACFAMALSGNLTKAGHEPERVTVEGTISLDKVEGGFRISGSHLSCEADVPGIGEAAFQEQVEAARVGCPVSKALGAIEITVDASLGRT